MDFLTLFTIICLVNCVFYFFDVIFKSCLHYPYIRFLQRLGLNVGFFKITWFTTAFNFSLFQFSNYHSKFLKKWFDLGVFATILLLPVSIVLLFISILNALKEGKTNGNNQDLILEPMVPGVNLPISDIGYYFATIALCSILHEVGHAIAAYKEGINVFGVGLIIIFIIPVAFVKINSEEMACLSPMRQLRIFCAGIWHNIILAALAYVALLSLPFLLSPLYDLGKGVYVMSVSENSKVSGTNGIFPGDKLVAINDCEVSDLETWHQCLHSFTNKPPPGYCVSEDVIHQLDESVPMKVLEDGTVECCGENKNSHLCFETLEDETPLQTLQYSCLPGRAIIAGTAYMCRGPKDCPPVLPCVRPVTPEGTTLLRIQRSRGNVVIYIGVPKHILATVSVSEYSQVFDLFSPRLPEVLIRLSKYFVLFSSGLAVMNAIPCFCFDGYHISYALSNFLNKSLFRVGNLAVFVCNVFGLVMFIFSFFILIWKFLSTVNFGSL